MENEIAELIKSTLNINCKLDNTTAVFPCATVDVYLEKAELYGNGKASKEIGYVQVDLFYLNKVERDTAINLLKDIIGQKYTHPTIHRYYDTTSKKYRATFNFSGLI